MGEILTTLSGVFTIRKIIGAISADELVDAVRDYYSGRITKYVVWDLTQGSVRQLTAADMKRIAETVRERAHPRAGGKTAIVAPTDLEFGMCRMLNAFSEIRNIPFETHTFRTPAEAAKWFGAKNLPGLDD